MSGKPLNDSERRNLLLILQADIDNGHTRDSAIGRAALCHGTGKQTLRDLLEAYDPEGLGAALPASTPAPPPPPGCMSQGRPRKFVTTEQGDKARSLVKVAHDSGRTITYTELYKTVRDEVKQPRGAIICSAASYASAFHCAFCCAVRSFRGLSLVPNI